MAKQRIVAPRSTKELVAAGNVGQDSPRELSITGDAVHEPAIIEPVPADALRRTDKLDKLKFMEDQVTLRVAQSSDKNAKPFVELFVNGIRQNVLKGREQTIKRKYVECMARMKLTTYTTDTPKDPSTGEARNIMNPSTGLINDFSVIHDPAGDRGRAWLNEVLAEA